MGIRKGYQVGGNGGDGFKRRPLRLGWVATNRRTNDWRESTAGLRWQAGGRVGPSPTHRGSSSSARSTMRACLFYFMDRSRTKVLSQHFAILFSSAHTGASFCSTFLICPASQRDPQCPPQCDCFRTQKISGTSRHPFLNVSGRCFMPLAFRRKYSLITTSLRCHDLPCPWNLFQLDRRSWVTARLEHSELLNEHSTVT